MASERVSHRAFLSAAALRFTAWKAHHLACCRKARGHGHILPVDAGIAWRHGLYDTASTAAHAVGGRRAIPVVIGVMNLFVTAVVTTAITGGRIAPAGERIARVTGIAGVGAGVSLIARTAGFG